MSVPGSSPGGLLPLEGKPQSCGALCGYVVGTLPVLEKVACHRLSVFVSV